MNIKALMEMAKLSEAAERYSDMAVYMSKLCEKKTAASEILDNDERNLLSVAFKNVVGSKRSSWRTLTASAVESTDGKKATGAEDDRKAYTTVVEQELEAVCNQVLELIGKLCTLLDAEIAKKAEGNKFEDMVFYKKMGGDYSRYLAEFKTDDTEVKTKTEEYYTAAMSVAKENLNETHPTRLGLALNFSVCYYEILKKPDEACKLAKEAFDAAIEKLDTLGDATYKDSTLIMQLLRDNLTLWTSTSDDAEPAAPEDDQEK